MAFDTLILNGTVVDGSGGPSYRGDVAIEGGRIAAVGDLSAAEAAERIDAAGCVVSPGFIDMHSHSDVTMLDDPMGDSKARQGVTTEVCGNCGSSPYPAGALGSGEALRKVNPTHAIPHSPTRWAWTDVDGWAEYTEQAGIGLNIIPQVGHGAVKSAAGVPKSRPANPDELAVMKRLVAESVEQGAWALTNGLTGAHFEGAPTSEIVALLEEVVRYEDGFYSTHPRLAGGWHFKAVEEAVEIGRQTGVLVEYSHIAIIDSRHHGKADEMASIFERARDDGVDIAFDLYPYLAGAAGFVSLTPAWMEGQGVDAVLEMLADPATRRRAREDMEGGWWGDMPWHFDKIVIVKVGPEGDRGHLGRSVEEIAESRGTHPLDTVLDMILEDPRVESVMDNRTEEDMRSFLAHPLSIVGSDGTAISPDGIWSVTQPHPRIYGTHPRVLGHYVREEGVISLEDAVRKMTGFPAERIGLRDRGRVEEGLAADLVVFDPDTVVDVATYEDPHRFPEGVPHVFVNGEAIVRDGELTGALPGRVLRRGA